MTYIKFLSFFVWKSIMSAPKCQKIPHLLTLLFVCSGLSPRDLILHFRHKVEKHKLSKDVDVWFYNNVSNPRHVSFTGSHSLQAHSAGEEGSRSFFCFAAKCLKSDAEFLVFNDLVRFVCRCCSTCLLSTD